jgi:hypothetical protein
MLIDLEGQSFDLQPAILDGMLDAMNQTAKDGLEHGFSMCKTPEGIVPGPKCVGNNCSIHITGCQVGQRIGGFHSHPDVISFSLGDYVVSAKEAKENDEKKYLLCVSLLDKGVRCKALKKVPSDSFLKTIPPIDSDFSRGMIKPYYTKKINLSVESLQKLMSGTPWSEIDTQTEVIAIDEGDKVVPPEASETPALNGNDESEVPEPTEPKESLMAYAKKFTQPPTGKYPWGTKQVTASVATGQGIGLQPASMPTLVDDKTQFIPAEDIEIPDPGLIAYGEVAGYMAAMSPIILTQLKDEKGKHKILDGRHRLASWRASGYQQIPVVFSSDTGYK